MIYFLRMRCLSFKCGPLSNNHFDSLKSKVLPKIKPLHIIKLLWFDVNKPMHGKMHKTEEGEGQKHWSVNFILINFRFSYGLPNTIINRKNFSRI